MGYVIRKKEKRWITMKLNDVGILKNIIGDKYREGEEYTMPKYAPKKLNFDAWSKSREEQKTKILDLTQVGKIGLLSPQVTHREQAERRAGAREVLAGWREQAAFAQEAQYQKEAAKVQRGYEQLQRTKLHEEERLLRERLKQEEALSKKRMRDDKTVQIEMEKTKVEREKTKQLAEREHRPVLEQKYTTEAKKWETKGREYDIKERELAFKEEAEWKKQKAAEQQLAEQEGLVRFESSAIGRFINPKSQWVQTAGRVSKNIGESLGGSIVGPFNEPGASRSLSEAITRRNAYVELVKQRYLSRKPPTVLHGATDILAYGTAGERKRLTDLNRGIERAQSVEQSSGFLGGTSGQFILGKTRAGAVKNLQPFTQVGYGGGNLGTFGPEALSRMGVTQSLTSLSPTTKWDTIFNRTPTPAEDRISFLLGKKPDPEGMAKLKRFL